MTRIALGSAQFGGAYGVARSAASVPTAVLAELLAGASEAGIDTIDTASVYGKSEERLGNCGVSTWNVITKLAPLPAAVVDGEIHGWVEKQVEASLARLKLARLHGLLVHRLEDLFESRGWALAEALHAVRATGQAEMIGVSIYDPRQLDTVFRVISPDVVQAPYNIVDRSLHATGWLDRLVSNRIQVHARSIFLQGLLLMRSAKRPPFFDRWTSLFAEWEKWLEEEHLTAVEACVRFACSDERISRVIVGVESLAQLREVLGAETRGPITAPEGLQSVDVDLIHPSHWRLP